MIQKFMLIAFLSTCAQANVISCQQIEQEFVAASEKALPESGPVNCKSLKQSITLLFTTQSACDQHSREDATELLEVLPKIYTQECAK